MFRGPHPRLEANASDFVTSLKINEPKRNPSTSQVILSQEQGLKDYLSKNTPAPYKTEGTVTLTWGLVSFSDLHDLTSTLDYLMDFTMRVEAKPLFVLL